MSYLRKKYNISSDDEEDENLDEVCDILNEVTTENKIKKEISKKVAKHKIKEKKEIISIKTNEELLTEYNKLLKQYWGYDALKDTQFEIIKKVVEEKKDVCAILATGFGKSICYQLPHLITQKNVIVISPLIALMHEQGQEMQKKGVPTAVFNSDSTMKKKMEEKSEIVNGLNKLIFMTPEYFVKSEGFIKSIEDDLALVCIDEAHAVSTWGLDFRASYTQLGVIRDWVPDVPILTLTATASTKVRDDINKILKLYNPELVIGNFDRPNLQISVEPRLDNILTNISTLLKKYQGEYVIIYCKTRDDTDLLADQIQSDLGVKCEAYHAGMNDKNRTQVQQNFIDGKVKCIIATIAFGMGINIPNVRLVIHYNCPKNLESYYQEIGRAGRDGKPSECVLFYSTKDFQINRYFLKSMENPIQKAYQENQIRQIEKYVYTSDCRRKHILENFGQRMETCTNCDNCIRKTSKTETAIELQDYTKEIYLILGLMSRIGEKFGIGMSINILLGKESKVKDWMIKFDEYCTGTSFGNDVWWKELFRILINNDLLMETQVQGMFATTIGLTTKGNNLRLRLYKKYPKYINLLQAFEDSDDEDYKKYIIKFQKIKSDKKTERKSKTSFPKKNKSKTTKTAKEIKESEINIKKQEIKVNKPEIIKVDKEFVKEIKDKSSENKLPSSSISSRLRHMIFDSDSE